MSPKPLPDGKNSAVKQQVPFVKPGTFCPESRGTEPTPAGSIGCAAISALAPSRARRLSSGSTRSPEREGSGTAQMIRFMSSSSPRPAPATPARPTDYLTMAVVLCDRSTGLPPACETMPALEPWATHVRGPAQHGCDRRDPGGRWAAPPLRAPRCLSSVPVCERRTWSRDVQGSLRDERRDSQTETCPNRTSTSIDAYLSRATDVTATSLTTNGVLAKNSCRSVGTRRYGEGCGSQMVRVDSRCRLHQERAIWCIGGASAEYSADRGARQISRTPGNTGTIG